MARGSDFPLGRRAVLGAMLLTVAAGCDSSGRRPARRARRGLVVATTDDLRTLDPALAYDTWSTSVVHAATRRLVDYDLRGRLVPDLAERWTVSGDGRTYTFRLRPARFGDGARIEAAHFRYALERVRNRSVASPGASFYGGIAAIATPDPRTLSITLRAPEPTFLNALGMTFAAPQRPGFPAAAEHSGAWSGPYLVAEYRPGVRVRLRRNPYDPAAAGWAEEIELQLRVNTALQWTRFRTGEVDLLPTIPPAELGRVLGDPAQRDNVAQDVVNQTWYFGMNTTRPPWSDPRVRRAALLAIDRRRQAQLAGTGRPANGILPPKVPGYDPHRRLPERDLETARRLVREAYPAGAPVSVLWFVQNDTHPRHAETIQSDLAAVGLSVELRPAIFSEYLSGYRTRADCWFGGWYPDFPDAGNFLDPVLHSGASSNAARYRNPRVDALLDRARVTPLGAERERLYRLAETLILEDVPWVPLYFEVETRYFRDGVQGVVVHPVWRQMLTGIRT